MFLGVKVSKHFLLVSVKSEQKLKHKSVKSKCFVGHVVECIDSTGEYTVKFIEREEQSRFSWPDNEDVTVIPNSDIKIKLPPSIVDRRECLSFPVSFDAFKMG